jgi:hypothetical protein
LLLRRKKKFAEERERSEGEERESRGGCLVVVRLPVVELVFLVVYRLVLLVFSPEKADVEEVERVAED